MTVQQLIDALNCFPEKDLQVEILAPPSIFGIQHAYDIYSITNEMVQIDPPRIGMFLVCSKSSRKFDDTMGEYAIQHS